MSTEFVEVLVPNAKPLLHHDLVKLVAIGDLGLFEKVVGAHRKDISRHAAEEDCARILLVAKTSAKSAPEVAGRLIEK